VELKIPIGIVGVGGVKAPIEKFLYSSYYNLFDKRLDRIREIRPSGA
jgi:hypothetical protein